MILRHILTFLIVPPVDLVLVAIAGLVLQRWWRKVGTAVLAVSLGGLLLLAIPAVGQAMLVALEIGLPLTPPPGDPPQAIVILSATLTYSARPGPHWQPGPLTLQRLRAGAALYRRTHLPILVTGGRIGPHKEVALADVMATSLRQDFAVPVRWTETRSETTWQNAEFSAAILEPLGIRSIYLVTHGWHERRALLAFRHFGFRVTAAPVAHDTLTSAVLPSARGWVTSYYALHEWIGTVVYALQAALETAPPIPTAARTEAARP